MTGNIRRAAAGAAAAIMLATGAGAALAADPTDAILQAAAEMTEAYDLPAGLLLAVAETESDFNPSCVTGKCRGLMQIHSSYAGAFARAAGMEDYDLLDPADSLRIAGYLLSDYMTRYEGDLHFALMAYNLGEYGALAKLAGGVDQTGYSRKVVERMERWATVGLPAAAEEEHLRDAAKMMPEDHIANVGNMPTEGLRAWVTGVWQWVKTEVLAI